MRSIGRHVTRLTGFAPALPTPFDGSGELDEGAFEHLCKLQLHEGANALVVGDAAGEAPTLTMAEHARLIHIAAKVADGAVPVIAGAGSNATWRAIELTRNAEAAGADAVLSVVPYYSKPVQRGLIFHFNEVRNASALPVILDDVPSRSACGMTDETVIALAAMPGIIGLKDGTGDLSRIARIRRRVGEEFRLLSGDDATALGYVAQGGNGCISVTSNVAPGVCREMYLGFTGRKPDLTRQRRIALAFAQLTAALSREAAPSPVKYALGQLLGLTWNSVRLPLVPASETTRQEVNAALDMLIDLYPDYLIDAPASIEGQRRHGTLLNSRG